MTTVWIAMTCLFVDDSPVTTDPLSITVLALMRRKELVPAVSLSVVVLVHKCVQPLAGHPPDW